MELEFTLFSQQDYNNLNIIQGIKSPLSLPAVSAEQDQKASFFKLATKKILKNLQIKVSRINIKVHLSVPATIKNYLLFQLADLSVHNQHSVPPG